MVKTDDLIFLGLNKNVVALNKKTGSIVWDWKAPEGQGYTTVLLIDEANLIASVMGYTYCLDPITGNERWRNRLKGIQAGVTSIAALGASTASGENQSSAHQQAVAAVNNANAANAY